MKTTLYFLVALMAFGLGACNKFKTDATTGREFLLRQAPKTQHFYGTTQFTGEKGMFFNVSGPYISLSTGNTLSGDPEFWLIEYLNKKDMMFGGLPTTSSGYPIATGGAFSLTTRVNGELAKPGQIEYMVPADTQNFAMTDFRGGLNGENFFDWLPYDPIAPTMWWTDSIGFGPGYQGFINPLSSWNYNSAFYVNCDHFLNTGLPLTNVAVRPSSETNFNAIHLSVSLLFDIEEVYMNGAFNANTDMYEFYNLPLGTAVNCIAVGVDNEEELYYGMLAFEVEENGIYTFQMDPITEEELEDVLDGL